MGDIIKLMSNDDDGSGRVGGDADEYLSRFNQAKSMVRHHDLEYTGCCHEVIKHKLAWLPTHTKDFGWVWLSRYYHFEIYYPGVRHDYWLTVGKLGSYENMLDLKREYYRHSNVDRLKQCEWLRRRGILR